LIINNLNLVGSGLLARAFAQVCQEIPRSFIYAAGVSNSSCRDEREFDRERVRLDAALEAGRDATAFVYFSTCSIADPDSRQSRYVQHKKEMENLVSTHRQPLIIRLPQVAGSSPNPHTLLNYLYARVSRSERFAVWKNARRNVIDIEDVVKIVRAMLEDSRTRHVTVNVANLRFYSIAQIVREMEKVTGKAAIVDELEKGVAYEIDLEYMRPIAEALGLRFDNEYLPHVIDKYFGRGRNESAIP
jgi:nucleoside-diphosphate-sugar epimerase